MKIRPLSFTQISLYRSCPLSYKLQYIDGLKPKDKWYFSFGTTLHACVERFFKVSAPPPPSLEELIKFYQQNWLSEGYISPEEEKRYKDFGKDILARFWAIHQADFHIPVALEKSFYIDIDGVKLRGFIDRVDKLESGGLGVIDYKTNQELFTADYLADDLQLTIYQMAAEQTWRLPVERLTLYHLRSNTACSCPPRGRVQLEQTRRLVLEVADGIARGEFPATENAYCPCDFPEHCPYHRHRYLMEAPEKASQELLPGMAAAEAVERYAGLQARLKELQTQLEEARQIIIEFCRSQGLNRVFGGEHEVTYKLMEKAGFSEDEVRAVLEPVGLWEKVLGLDQSRLKQFLADEATAGDIRRKIESLRRITATYPQLWLKKRTGGRSMKSGTRGQPPKFTPSGALMARLLLIRHGQTRLHRPDRFWGKTDIELSDIGIRQGEQLRDRLAPEKINAIYSSTLSRARVTAEIIASRHKAKVILCEELRECSFGYVEGLIFEEITQKYPELAGELSQGKAVAFPGGESLEQLDKRVRSFLEKLKQHKPSSTVAIIAHGGPLRLIICHLLGLGIEHWMQLQVDHASLSVVETYPQGAILNLLNDVSHLKS